MRGDAKVIEHLNTALRMELTAVNQYFLHSAVLKKWGYTKLASKLQEEAAEESGHASLLVERILFLGGTPVMDKLDEIKMVDTVKAIHESDLEDEISARQFYIEAANYCDEVKDRLSGDIFQQLAADEEGHIAWLESQLEQISQLGEQGYLQAQLG